jgi:hypothetical protein
MKGLKFGMTVIDIEKFCRENLKHWSDKKNGNADYSDGIKDALREILTTFFKE